MTSRLAKATTAGVHWAEPLSLSRKHAAGRCQRQDAQPTAEEESCPGFGASRLRAADPAKADRWQRRAILWLVGLASVAWAGAQVLPLKRIRDFRMPEFYEASAAGESPRLKTLLTGSEAQPLDGRGRLIALTGMRVENYLPDGRTNLVARAPTCLLDALDRTVCSTGWLEVSLAQGQLFIEGQGFFLQVTNLHFIISNRVRTVIRPELVQQVQP